MASRVSAMSVMTPSVRISRMKYCCNGSDVRQRGTERWGNKDKIRCLHCILATATATADVFECLCVDSPKNSRL